MSASATVALERACLADWPALHRADDNGWTMCATMGRSWRANSVWPLEWRNEQTLDNMLERCAAFATTHAIPLAFKLADGGYAPTELPHRLAALGFAPSMETLVMTRPLATVTAPERDIALPLRLADDFANVLRKAAPSHEDYAERLSIIKRMREGSIFPLLRVDGEAAAIGIGAQSGTTAGLYAMRTAPNMRRRGLARDLVRSICAWAKANGATLAFLQVEADNAPAVALYESEGFTIAYRYHYWLRP
jgi:GNAT superfamily N-acetyltransferase